MSTNVPKRYLTIVNSPENFIGVLEITEKYLGKNINFADEINEYIWRFRSLFDLIPHTVEKLFSGHVFPFTEAEYELEGSVAFVEMGYYKHAIATLRNVLELGLLSVYFDVDDRSEVDIKNWLRSAEPTPFRKAVEVKLASHPNVQYFSERYPLFNKLSSLYGKLCDYSHTRGAKFSSHKLSHSNTNQFSETSFHLWFSLMKEVVEILAILHLLKYPIGLQHTPIEDKFGINGPVGSFLSPCKSDNLKKIIDRNALIILQEISDNDHDVKGVLEWIHSFPDITREELVQQFEDHDKLSIEGGGLEQWLKNQKVHYKNIPKDSDEYKEKQAYIKKMKQWAKENGYDKQFGFGIKRASS